jgi:hypothetical protein
MYFNSRTGRRRWQTLNLDTIGHDLASSPASRSCGGADQMPDDHGGCIPEVSNCLRKKLATADLSNTGKLEAAYGVY